MVTLAELRGQDRVVELLRRALSSGRVAPAYLFAGPADSGKHTAGLALAAALNCVEAPLEGCYQCAACTRIAEGTHPDVMTLEPQGAKQIIPIEVVRSQVIASLGMPPHEGKARVFLVGEAAALLGPAANALLKTLEEPPAATHFVLATRAPDKLLPTIRSRCQRINFRALGADERAQLSGDEQAAEAIRKLSDAMALGADGRGLGSILDAAAIPGKDRDLLLGALQHYASRCHSDARRSVEAGDLRAAETYALRAHKVLDAQRAVSEHNAHGQLALEHLLVELRKRSVVAS